MSNWEELKQELGRATDELSKIRDARKGPERDRLKGKVEGVQLCLSYMDDLERLGRIR